MRVCLRCKTTRYTKKKSYCPKCKNTMIHIDGRLRKVVEVLHSLDIVIAFAYCESHTSSSISTAEIIIGLGAPYDKLLFEELPEHFEFMSDKYANQSPFSLNYILNHMGKLMSMILLDYGTLPGRNAPASVVLKEEIEELYTWAESLRGSGRWSVWKLLGDI